MTFLYHIGKFQGKLNTFGDASRTFPILVGNEDLDKKRNEEVKHCGIITDSNMA